MFYWKLLLFVYVLVLFLYVVHYIIIIIIIIIIILHNFKYINTKAWLLRLSLFIHSYLSNSFNLISKLS
jgi:hypothetical protein